MYDQSETVATSCVKVLFRNIWQKKKKNKKSIKVVTVHNITEKKLHLDSIYYSQTQT